MKFFSRTFNKQVIRTGMVLGMLFCGEAYPEWTLKDELTNCTGNGLIAFDPSDKLYISNYTKVSSWDPKGGATTATDTITSGIESLLYKG